MILEPITISLRPRTGTLRKKHELGARAEQGLVVFQVDGKGAYYRLDPGLAQRTAAALSGVRFKPGQVLELLVGGKLVTALDELGAKRAAGVLARKASEARKYVNAAATV